MKTFYKIRVYVLTDKNGEWWEDVGQDGTIRLFKSGTRFNRAKAFNSEKKAITFAQNTESKRFKVIKMEPPISPSTTWRETVVFETGIGELGLYD